MTTTSLDAPLTVSVTRRAVEVPAGPGAAALTRICAVMSGGDVPVVTDEHLPAEARQRVVDAVAGRLAELPPEPLLAVLTSGSTGAPRAVLRTLKSWTASHRKIDAAFGLRRDDVVWAPGSLASTLTLFAAHHARATGRRAVLSGPWRGVEAALPAGAAEATVVEAVPPIVSDVLEAAAQGLLPALRTAVVAGAHVPPALRARAVELGVRLVEYYGAAELSFVIIDGDPAPGAEVRLRTCERGDGVGEIWVRSPYLALGYVEGQGPLRFEDGWASVGDLGRLDADGVLQVLGRGDGTVTVGGSTVCLSEVEGVLRGVADVDEVVCVGEPHDRFGERLVAVVRAAPGTDPRAALKEAARSGLPQASRPSRWLLAEDLPRTPGGKTDRTTLVAWVRERP